ncbi:hypothetical protein E2C01_034531 [Portunus trituberculatus]|uniref:Uncharacterized protein n=1 Tax=Portunus trituberculatus TaxID=210409 RepID=A0A5B7F8R4_PORTR|nr:hypothetical protein [Portunus trituberculatus]
MAEIDNIAGNMRKGQSMFLEAQRRTVPKEARFLEAQRRTVPTVRRKPLVVKQIGGVWKRNSPDRKLYL